MAQDFDPALLEFEPVPPVQINGGGGGENIPPTSGGYIPPNPEPDSEGGIPTEGDVMAPPLPPPPPEDPGDAGGPEGGTDATTTDATTTDGQPAPGCRLCENARALVTALSEGNPTAAWGHLIDGNAEPDPTEWPLAVYAVAVLALLAWWAT